MSQQRTPSSVSKYANSSFDLFQHRRLATTGFPSSHGCIGTLTAYSTPSLERSWRTGSWKKASSIRNSSLTLRPSVYVPTGASPTPNLDGHRVRVHGVDHPCQRSGRFEDPARCPLAGCPSGMGLLDRGMTHASEALGARCCRMQRRSSRVRRTGSRSLGSPSRWRRAGRTFSITVAPRRHGRFPLGRGQAWPTRYPGGGIRRCCPGRGKASSRSRPR